MVWILSTCGSYAFRFAVTGNTTHNVEGSRSAETRRKAGTLDAALAAQLEPSYTIRRMYSRSKQPVSSYASVSYVRITVPGPF